MEQANTTEPRVHIIDSPDTSDASKAIVHGLNRLGVDATAPLPRGENQVLAVVVLLSAGALDDPTWRRSVKALRAERLVPVKVGDVVDDELPDFLRELNWVFFRPNDQAFLAHLFTGINTDASRFRNVRDTRALAERWELGGRDTNLLIEDLGEVRRRIDTAVVSADGADPMIPPHQASHLTANFRERYKTFSELLRVDDNPPPWFVPLVAVWFALFHARLDHELVEEAATPVAFLAASRLHAARLTRRRLWRITYRTVLAGVAAVAIGSTVVTVQQAVKKSRNAVSFAIGDSASTSRPDLAAIKAGASLVDSGDYSGLDGRFRIAVNALSQHWPSGYLPMDNAVVSIARFLDDGSITAVDYDGSIWNWNTVEGTGSRSTANGRTVTGGDISASGDLAVITDGFDLAVVSGSDTRHFQGLDTVGRVRLATANDRLLVQSGDGLYVFDDIMSKSPTVSNLGEWDSVIDIVQTGTGHAVALVERDGILELVHDDGTTVSVGALQEEIDIGALSNNGKAFSLVAAGTVWTWTGDDVVSSGILVPGIVKALRMTDDGTVLVSERTRGSWAADPRLGVVLGPVCDGITGTEEFSVNTAGDQVLCLNGASPMIDEISDLQPAAIGESAPEPVSAISSNGRLESLSLVDGFIKIARADGTSFAFDSAGLSFEPSFSRPASIADVDFFATGALIEAEGRPTTVGVKADGNTFAIGFLDGHVIEVDVDASGYMAPVGSWRLPDHSPVVAISWSADSATISATTAPGTVWDRPSCSGCWADRTVFEHIADRAWTCYHRGDIEELGDTVRSAFRLRDCEAYRDGEK